MRYEFIHDSIAKQVFFKAGAEARTRRKVEKYIRERYYAHRARGAELTEDDLEYVHPYLGLINISAAEARFLREAEARLKRKRLRRRLLALGTIAILLVATIVSLSFWFLAADRAQEAEDALAKAEQSRQEAERARRKAEAAYLRADSLAGSLQRSLAVADRERQRAQRAQQEAERRSAEAQALAMAVQARTIREEQPIVSLQLAKTAYGRLPAAPLPTVSQTLGSLFYDQFSYRNEPGAPLFESVIDQQADRVYPAWSPRGDHFLVHTEPPTVRMYQSSGALAQTFSHEQRITANRWAPDGRRLATGDAAGKIKVWSADGSLRFETKMDDWVAELRFSPDGAYLYAWSSVTTLPGPPWLTLPRDNQLHIWDRSGQPAGTGALPIRLILSLDFAADGRSLLLSGTNGMAQTDLRGQVLWQPLGLSGSVQQFEYSGASNRLLVQDSRRDYHLYRLGQPVPLQSWRQTSSTRTTVRLAPDGTAALFYNGRDSLVLLDLSDGSVQFEYPGWDIRQFAFSATGRHVVLTTGAAQSLWRNRTDPLRLTQQPNPFARPVFAPDDRSLVIKTRDDGMLLWRAERENQVLPLTDIHQKTVRAIHFDPTGKWFLSQENGTRAYLWTRSGELVSRYDKHSENLIGSTFSPDGAGLLTADQSGRVFLWSLDQPVLAQTFGGQTARVSSLFPLPGTDYFLASYQDHTLVLHAPGHGSTDTLVRAGPDPVQVAFAPNGRWIALRSPQQTLTLLDTSGRRLPATVPAPLARTAELAFSRDSSFLIGLDPAGELLLWSIARDTLYRRDIPPAADRRLAVSSRGDRLLITGGDRRVKTKAQSLTLPAVAAFSPRGDYFVTDAGAPPPWLFRFREGGTSGPEISRIDLAGPDPERHRNALNIWTRDGRLRGTAPLGRAIDPADITFAADGNFFAVRPHEGSVAVYDDRGNYRSLLNKRMGQAYGVTFSPDNRHLLATYGNRNVQVFDRQGNLVVLLNQHQDTVSQATFAPDGQLVLTVAGNVAKLFSLRGKLMAEFDRHDGAVKSARFSPNGRFVITLDSEGTVRRYPLPSRIYAWLNGEGRLPRISSEERQRYGLTEFQLPKGD